MGFALSSGNALDVKNIAVTNHHTAIDFLSDSEVPALTGYHAAAMATILLSKGSEFAQLTQQEVDDVRNQAVREVISVLFEDDDDVDLRQPPPLSAEGINEYVEMKRDSFASNVIFHEVMTPEQWGEIFVDTISQAEPDLWNLTVHVGVVQNGTNPAAFTVAWQVSKEHNKMLLQAEAAHHFQQHVAPEDEAEDAADADDVDDAVEPSAS